MIDPAPLLYALLTVAFTVGILRLRALSLQRKAPRDRLDD